MTRRTSRRPFQEKLSVDAVRQHVEQMVEIRQYVNERGRGLYPLSPDHNALADLNKAIDKHIGHWTGNDQFCHSGHTAQIWFKEPGND